MQKHSLEVSPIGAVGHRLILPNAVARLGASTSQTSMPRGAGMDIYIYIYLYIYSLYILAI